MRLRGEPDAPIPALTLRQKPFRGLDALVDGRMGVEEPEPAADGRSSARFCAPRRRIAEMNAAGRPVSVSAKRSARRSLWRDQALPTGVSSSDTPPAASSDQRQRGQIGGSRDAEDARRARRRRRARRAAPAATISALDRQRRPDVVMDVVRDLVREDHLDLVVGVVLEQRVGHQDAARPSDADQRRVRPRRLLAEPPLERAEHRHAGALARASAAARATRRDRADGTGRRAASASDRRDPRRCSIAGRGEESRPRAPTTHARARCIGASTPRPRRRSSASRPSRAALR